METYSEIRESKMTEIMTAELWLLCYYYGVYRTLGTSFMLHSIKEWIGLGMITYAAVNK